MKTHTHAFGNKTRNKTFLIETTFVLCSLPLYIRQVRCRMIAFIPFISRKFALRVFVITPPVIFTVCVTADKEEAACQGYGVDSYYILTGLYCAAISCQCFCHFFFRQTDSFDVLETKAGGKRV